MIIYKSTKFLVETHRGAGSAGPEGAVRARPADHRSRARPQSHKINTSSVLLQVLIRVRVRVTKLVYQIGFTTLFKSQRRENVLEAASKQQQQRQASKQQATELISAYPHISINIDGISPKLSWYIVLMML